MVQYVEKFERRLDRVIRFLEIGLRRLAALVGPGEENRGETEGIRAGDVAFKIVANHDRLSVVDWDDIEAVESGLEHTRVGLVDTDGFGYRESIEVSVQAVLCEDVLERSDRSVCTQGKGAAALLQFDDQPICARDQLRTEGLAEFVFDFRQFIDECVAAVQQ